MKLHFRSKCQHIQVIMNIIYYLYDFLNNRDWDSSLRFVFVLRGTSRQEPEWYIQRGHGRCVPHPFQFFTQHLSMIRCCTTYASGNMSMNADTFHERRLCNWSRTSVQTFLSVQRVYSMSICNTLK
jgi:hypothetical protein